MKLLHPFFFDGLLMLFLDLFNSPIKPMWYDVFQDVVFERLVIVFFRVYNDINNPKESEEFICVALLVFGSRPRRRATSRWYELLLSENFTFT